MHELSAIYLLELCSIKCLDNRNLQNWKQYPYWFEYSYTYSGGF